MFKGKRKIAQVLIPDMPKERLSLVMAVDQYPSQDFNRNDAGWISNDLSNLARAQSQAEVELLLKRLTEVAPQKSNLPKGASLKGASLKQAFDLIRPRYCQTENEFVDFAVGIGAKAQDNLDAAYAAVRAKQIASAPAPAPAPAPAE